MCIFKLVLFFVLGLYSCRNIEHNELINVNKSILFLLKEAENSDLPLEDRLINAMKADTIATINGNDSARLESMKLIAMLNLKLMNDSLAKDYFQQAAGLALQLNDDENLGIALNNIGFIFHGASRFDSAINYYERAIKVFGKQNNKLRVAQALANIGMIYKIRGDFEEAFKISMDALQVLEVHGSQKEVSDVYSTLGAVLKELHRFDDALLYHEKALHIRETEKDSIGIAGSLNNIGNVFRQKRDYTNALTFYYSSLQIKEKTGTKKSIATAFDNIAETYLALFQYDSATKYFEKALLIRESLSDVEGYLTTANRVCNLYLKTNAYGKAEILAKQASYFLPQVNSKKQNLENALTLNSIYTQTGNYQLASEQANIALRLKDEIFDEEITRSVAEMNIKYQIEKREEKIHHERIAGLIASISILIISSFSFYFWKKKKFYDFNKTFLETKLEASNAKMSDHFIGNALDSINQFIKSEDVNSASDYLIKFDRLIRRVLVNAPEKLIPLNDDLDMLKDYLEIERLRFSQNALEYHIIIDENIDKDHLMIPPLVFQTLAENSIKHAFNKEKGGTLIFKVLKQDNLLINCSVEDNGSGFTALKATKIEKSHGIELAKQIISLCAGVEKENFLEIINLEDENPDISGTRIEYIIPFIQAD